MDSLAANLNDATKALGQRDVATALELSIKAWRITPDSELAETIERLARFAPDSRFARRMPRSLAETTTHLLRLGRRKPDPRFATLLHQLIDAPPFGDNRFWRLVFGLLIETADPRSVDVVAACGPRLEAVTRQSSRRYAERQRVAAVAALRAKYPDPPRLGDKDAKGLARLIASVDQHERVIHNATGDGATLLAAIRENPDDDRPRLVYADWLQERDDPRGELIALQLATGDADPARARRIRTLIKAHGKRWLGVLEPVIAAWRMRFERGFLAVAAVNARPAQIESVVGAPEWFSVMELSFVPNVAHIPVCASIVCHPVMRSLRVVEGLGNAPASLVARASIPLGITSLGIVGFNLDVDAFAECPALPSLERIAITRSPYDRGIDSVLALLATPVGRRLRAIGHIAEGMTFELRRDVNGVLSRLQLELPVATRSARELDRQDLAELAAHVGTIAEIEVLVRERVRAEEPTYVLGALATLPRKITTIPRR